MTNLNDQWEVSCQYLAHRDPILNELISRYQGQKLHAGKFCAFHTLANAIIGQQISVKAAASVRQRFIALVGKVEPQNILTMQQDRLREAGLSARKTEYITCLAQAFLDGTIDLQAWNRQTDEEVISQLIKLKGIGHWTAEMFLIFHLGRPDVLPIADLGLLKAASQTFGWPYSKNPKELLCRAETWRPWRTVAVWHLWRELDSQPVAY